MAGVGAILRKAGSNTWLEGHPVESAIIRQVGGKKEDEQQQHRVNKAKMIGCQ